MKRKNRFKTLLKKNKNRISYHYKSIKCYISKTIAQRKWKIIDTNDINIHEVINEWKNNHKKKYSTNAVIHIPTEKICEIGSVWCITTKWKNDIETKKYKKISKQIKNNNWSQNHPIIIGIADNGIINIIDGNHRILLALKYNIKKIPVLFHYFKVGEHIAPKWLKNGWKIWDGENLKHSCFPRGSCDKCDMCKKTLPEFKINKQKND